MEGKWFIFKMPLRLIVDNKPFHQERKSSFGVFLVCIICFDCVKMSLLKTFIDL